MSYRNPTQVVDTQTGQHYANLQKTIAGSFGNYANSVRVADAKKQKENELKAKKEADRRNGLIKQADKNKGLVARVDANNPNIDLSDAKRLIDFSAEIQMNSPTRTYDQNQTVSNINLLGEFTRGKVGIMMQGQQEFVGHYNKGVGKMGGFSKNAQLEDSENLYKTTEKGLLSTTKGIFGINGSNDTTLTFQVTDPNGVVKEYDTENGAPPMPQTIPDWQPSVNSFVKQGLTNEEFNYRDYESKIYKDGRQVKDNNGKIIGVLPNAETYKDTIRKGVKANVIAGLRANDTISLYNNITKKEGDPDIEQTSEWLSFEEDDQSPEAINQRENQKLIVNAAVDFVANQADYLKRPYIYQQADTPPPSPGDTETPVNGGKEFYNEVKKNPVGMYQEYVGIKQISFNREKNIITIGKEAVSGYDKDDPDLTKDVVYNMNDSTDRNRFYINLLKASERTKGTSVLSKEEQKGYEDALRSDTSYRSSKLDKKKKEAEAKAKAKADAEAKAKADALKKEMEQAAVYKKDKKRGNQATKRSN